MQKVIEQVKSDLRTVKAVLGFKELRLAQFLGLLGVAVIATGLIFSVTLVQQSAEIRPQAAPNDGIGKPNGTCDIVYYSNHTRIKNHTLSGYVQNPLVSTLQRIWPTTTDVNGSTVYSTNWTYSDLTTDSLQGDNPQALAAINKADIIFIDDNWNGEHSVADVPFNILNAIISSWLSGANLVITGDNGILPVTDSNGTIIRYDGDFAAGTVASVINQTSLSNHWTYHQKDGLSIGYAFPITDGVTATGWNLLPSFALDTTAPLLSSPGVIDVKSSSVTCFKSVPLYVPLPVPPNPPESPDINVPMSDGVGGHKYTCLVSGMNNDLSIAGVDYDNGFVVLDGNAGNSVKYGNNLETLVRSNEDCRALIPSPTPTNTPVVPTATPTNTPIVVVPSATPTNTPVVSTATPSLTPEPTDVNAPLCTNVTLQNTSTSQPTDPINIGHVVTLRCSQVASATRYEFRLGLPDETLIRLEPSTTTPYVSEQHVISQLGNYSAYCRPCNGNACSAWQQ